MELSAIIKEYSVPLTSSERNLVDQLPSSSSAVSEDRYAQRMKDLAVARDVLKRLPDRQTMERQNKADKAAMLKERLKMLRQMIPFMSHAAVKSLMAEMKQIAAQIASLGAGSGGGTGGAIAAPEATVTAALGPGNKAGTAPQTVQASGTDQVNAVTQQKYDASGSAVPLNGGNAEDRQLKETVEELKSLFNAVLAAMKRKRQPGQTSKLRVYANLQERVSSVAINV